MQLTHDIASEPLRQGLTRRIKGHDQTGKPDEIPVVEKRPLTIRLNSLEIATAMTIGTTPTVS